MKATTKATTHTLLSITMKLGAFPLQGHVRVVRNIKLRAIFLGAIFQVSHHQRTIKKPVHENASSIQRESRVRPSPELMWIKLKISSLNELESCATCKRSLSYNNNGGPKFG